MHTVKFAVDCRSIPVCIGRLLDLTRAQKGALVSLVMLKYACTHTALARALCRIDGICLQNDALTVGCSA